MINENIKRIRKFVGISQRELGRRIKMSGQYIAKIEKSEKTPPIDTIKKIAIALDVELLEIIERPKFLIELFLDYIYEHNILIQEIFSNTNLTLSDISCLFFNFLEGNGYDHEIFDLGNYLGFSEAFCKRKLSFDIETISFMSDSDFISLYDSVKTRLENWLNFTKDDKYSEDNTNISYNEAILGLTKYINYISNIEMYKLSDKEYSELIRSTEELICGKILIYKRIL
ncbi:helix-turn-helix transcriptional regulator [uncultured Clostridium sp.]|uniref:helix-turn-helix domain-containing protein n=1 Tax=uncultured Clostridium sp. TaxID=59620 RepID=UPI0025DD75E1|nr:helix-turn-helix transcriptional regulator [uncultured Clostridium sp.]